MTEPTTELDARFSDPGSEATSWGQTRSAIEQAELFWITTVRADGRPHVTPLVAVWHDGALHFSTGDGEQKALNLAGNPHVILTTGTNDWNRGLDIVVEGRADRVKDPERLAALAEAWARKWNGRWRYEAGDEGFRPSEGGGASLVYAVRPAKILAFGKGTFTHTRHRFPTSDRRAQPADPGVDPGLVIPGAITYLHIPAADVRRAAEFYRDVFGWTVRDVDGDRPSFDDPSGRLSGAWISRHAAPAEPGLLLYVYVDDVEESVRRIVAHGGEIVTDPFPEGLLTVAVFRDPAGNVLGLWHDTRTRPAAHPVRRPADPGRGRRRRAGIA